MGFSASFCSEMFRARRMHIGFVLLALYLGIALLYVFARSGAWVGTWVLADGNKHFIGFSADPFYSESIGFSAPEAERSIAASLAHTALFPVIAVLIAGMFFDAPAQGAATMVSQARGVGKFGLYIARIAVCCLYAGAAYVVFSILVFAAYCISGLTRFDTASSLLLALRLVPNIAINTSFIVLCISMFMLLRIRSLASGGLLVLTYAGLVVAMSSSSSIIPAHMAYWIRTCGIFGADVWGAIVFSMASCILYIVAVGTLLRIRRDMC